jgi:hypothetical protein
VNDHFAIFGNEVDPDLKKLRREEIVDDLLLELKPVTQQIMKLMRQFLPDEDVARVVGPLSRPFQITRAEIQGEWEISGTVDLRNIDTDWLKEKRLLEPRSGTDTMGILDKAALLKTGAKRSITVSPTWRSRIRRLLRRPRCRTNSAPSI